MNFLSLFAGIGGIDLGLERAGLRCVGQVEIDPFCRRVLAKHWPNVWRWADVKDFSAKFLGVRVDLVAGGFPCQPVSQNGKKKGQDDARWLWPEFHRVVCEVRPQWAFLENVAGLLDRGLDEVLGDLAESGYDAEWDCIPAAAFGAEHIRDRVFILAYPAGTGPQRQESAGRVWGRGLLTQRNRWSATPRVLRGGDGFPDRVDRIKALGNAVVPQVAEWIGRRLLNAVRERDLILGSDLAGHPLGLRAAGDGVEDGVDDGPAEGSADDGVAGGHAEKYRASVAPPPLQPPPSFVAAPRARAAGTGGQR